MAIDTNLPGEHGGVRGLLQWLDDIGGRERFDDHVLLQLGEPQDEVLGG